MLSVRSPLSLRAMGVDDIEAIMAIDRVSFPTPVKEKLYTYELTQNTLARYQVLKVVSDDAEELVGYSGYWQLGDESHISTIAVKPEWRRKHLGGLLLLNMLILACKEESALVTLEVRRSNQTAQAMYHKYDFKTVGMRSKYYRDTGDDAILMTRMLDNSGECDSLRQIAADLVYKINIEMGCE